MKRVRVGDVAEQVRGVTFAKKDSTKEKLPGHTAVLTASNITEGGLQLSPLQYVPNEMVRSTQKLKNGDILVTASSGSLDVVGRAVLVDRDLDAGFGAFCKVLRFNDQVDPRYVAHYFRTTEYRSTVSRLAAGANINNLRNEDLDGIEIPLPPLPEQRRIASILDESQRVIDSRSKQLQLLDELESEMYRSSMANADSTTHSKVPLKDLVANLASGKSIVGSDNDAGEFRVLKISAVTSGEFMANQAKPLPAGYVPLDGHLVREGDVLMSRANTAALVGATAMVREPVSGLALPDKLWRLEWRDAYRPFAVFFWRQLRSAGVRAAMSRMASGSGGAMKNLSQSDVLELELVVPPEALMRRFQEDWKALQSLRGQIAAHWRKAESAKRSLQARAFRGDL